MRLLAVFWLTFAAAVAPFSVPAAAEEAVTPCSRGESGADRTLCHETIVDAPIAEVWRLFSTSEGFSSWAAPVAAIDLRVGGQFETSYDRNGHIGAPGNIHNRVVAFTPEALLVMQVAAAPPGFPHPSEVRELVTVLEFEALGAQRTRVRVSMVGYREGAAFDELFQFFDAGNAWTLNKLRERVSSGPIDWHAATGGAH